jgi:hypothetical protein
MISANVPVFMNPARGCLLKFLPEIHPQTKAPKEPLLEYYVIRSDNYLELR